MTYVSILLDIISVHCFIKHPLDFTLFYPLKKDETVFLPRFIFHFIKKNKQSFKFFFRFVFNTKQVILIVEILF